MNEFRSCSRWFKRAIILALIIYVGCWGATIYLKSLQTERGIAPVLPVMTGDSVEFAALTQSIKRNRSFDRDGVIETLRAPGYPFFAAIISTLGRSLFAVTFVQILLVFISAFIIRRIGIVVASVQAGEIAALLFLFNPVSLTLSLIFLTDTLFLFLFVLGFYLALTMPQEKYARQLGIVVVLFSAAIHVRPMGLFALPIFVAPFFAARISQKVRITSIIVIIFALFVTTLPWTARNYVATGVASFSSFRSLNSAWAATQFLADHNNTNPDAEIAAFGRATGIVVENWRDLRYASALSRYAEQIIMSHPISYIRFHIITSVPFLTSSPLSFAVEDYHFAMHTHQPFRIGSIHALVRGEWSVFFEATYATWWKTVDRLWYLCVYIVVLRTLWVYRKKVSVWSFVVVIAYLMVLAGPASNARYAFQAYPFIFLLFSHSFVDIFKKYKDWKYSK